jgi:hypothetical protein
VFRRVPTDELDGLVVRLVAGWLERRVDGEDFRSFCDRIDDEALGVLAGREPAKARPERQAA